MEWGRVVHFQAGSGFSVGLFIYFCLRPSRDLPPTRSSFFLRLLLVRYSFSSSCPSPNPFPLYFRHCIFFCTFFVVSSFSSSCPWFSETICLSQSSFDSPLLNPFSRAQCFLLAPSSSLYLGSEFEACAERPGSGNLIY